MEDRGVGEAIAELLAVDVAGCDRAGLGAAVTLAQRVRGWVDAIDVAISKRAAKDQLCVSDSRINAMLAHIRGEATEPTIARKNMDAKLAEPANAELYKQRSQVIERWRITLDKHRVLTIHRPDGTRHFHGTTTNRTGRAAAAEAAVAANAGDRAQRRGQSDTRDHQRPTARASGPP